MKRIKNPWAGKENYFCFGCCPDNPSGVHMKFYADGEEVISVWSPQPQFQGWIDTMHGGIQAVLLDEICAWAVILKMNTTGVTAEMETRPFICSMNILPSRFAIICAVAYLIPSILMGSMHIVPAGIVSLGSLTPQASSLMPRFVEMFCS